MADRRAPAIAVGAVLGLVVLLGCVVAVGAAAGPGEVVTGKGHRTQPRSAVTLSMPSPTTDPRSQGPDHRRDRPLPGWLGWVMVALVGGAALVVGYGLWVAARRDRWRFREGHGPPGVPDEPVTDLRAVTDRLHASVDEQLATLADGEPRNAIVACWQLLERLFEEAGAARQPWETSTEFTLRVLRDVNADPDGVRRLAALYREARFSDHPMAEAQRAEAQAALTVVHASLIAAGVRGGR